MVGGELVQEVGAVEGVSLLRDKARVANHVPEVFLCRLMMGAGRGHHVLFDHDAADVVTAKAEAYLTGLQAGRDPGALDVEDIVKIDARDGQRLWQRDQGSALRARRGGAVS